MEGEKVGAHSQARNTSGVEGCVRTLGWGLKINKQVNYLHGPAKTKQQVS